MWDINFRKTFNYLTKSLFILGIIMPISSKIEF